MNRIESSMRLVNESFIVDDEIDAAEQQLLEDAALAALVSAGGSTKGSSFGIGNGSPGKRSSGQQSTKTVVSGGSLGRVGQGAVSSSSQSALQRKKVSGQVAGGAQSSASAAAAAAAAAAQKKRPKGMSRLEALIVRPFCLLLTHLYALLMLYLSRARSFLSTAARARAPRCAARRPLRPTTR